MKILAVDDDSIILELLAHLIKALGDHEIETAESAQDALDLITSSMTRFDCFLFDIQMPGMDGVSLAKEIKKSKCYTDAPIIMLTAMTDKRYIDAAFAAGAMDYITKPFEIEELRTRISRVEDMIESQKANQSKTFIAHSARDQNHPIGLYESISIYDVESVIEYTAMENYVLQLSRGAIFGSTTFAFTIRNIEAFHTTLTPFEFYSVISDVAEVISDTLQGHQFLMSYAGNGTFVCVTENGWRPDMDALMTDINDALASTELYDNSGQRLHPQISAGEATRLIWKTGDAVMDALACAHSSAEDACARYMKMNEKLWDLGQSA